MHARAVFEIKVSKERFMTQTKSPKELYLAEQQALADAEVQLVTADAQRIKMTGKMLPGKMLSILDK